MHNSGDHGKFIEVTDKGLSNSRSKMDTTTPNDDDDDI